MKPEADDLADESKYRLASPQLARLRLGEEPVDHVHGRVGLLSNNTTEHHHHHHHHEEAGPRQQGRVEEILRKDGTFGMAIRLSMQPAANVKTHNPARICRARTRRVPALVGVKLTKLFIEDQWDATQRACWTLHPLGHEALPIVPV